MSIQRWDHLGGATPRGDGDYVTYANHLAEVERVRDEWMRYTNRCEYKATEAERERIVEIVEAIEHWTAYDQHGDMHACYASDPITAIKGDSA